VPRLQSSNRQPTIDLMRGLAALFVATDHFLRRLHVPTFPRGHLAVELFFVMSGFVLTAGTLDHRRGRSTATRFMLRRLSRLYPVYSLGLAAGVLEYVVAKYFGLPGWITPVSAGDVIANSLLFPAVWSAGTLFPINGPMWTLPIEIGVNAVLFPLVRLRTASLLFFVVLTGAAMTMLAYRAGSLNLGWSLGTMVAGWARGAFAFCTGIFLGRAKRFRLESSWWLLPVISGFALIAACPSPAQWELSIEIVGALAVVPILFFLASSVPLPDRAASIARLLAGMSYPLFCLHAAIIRPVIKVGQSLRMADGMMAGIYLVLCVGVALGVANFPLFASRIRRIWLAP